MSVYDTLSADPAALMNPEAQRAVFDSINHKGTSINSFLKGIPFIHV